MIKWITVCLLLFLFFSNAPAQWQTWPNVTVEGQLTDNWMICLDEEFRFNHSTDQLYFHRSNVGLTHSFSERLWLSFNYWHDYNRKGESWQEERRPHLNIYYSNNHFPTILQWRNRFEYRLFHDMTNQWRYRSRLKMKFPVKPFNRFSPYFADELFYNLNANELRINRVYLGVVVQLLDRLFFDGYYLLAHKKRSDQWHPVHVFGSRFKIQFN
jgi:hypothetical protein